MGAHSTLCLTRLKALEIRNKLLNIENPPTVEELETLFDNLLDKHLYNVIIVDYESYDTDDSYIEDLLLP